MVLEGSLHGYMVHAPGKAMAEEGVEEKSCSFHDGPGNRKRGRKSLKTIHP